MNAVRDLAYRQWLNAAIRRGGVADVGRAFRDGWAAAMECRDRAAVQTTLFGDRATGPAWVPHVHGSETSRSAAVEAVSSARAWRQRVLDALLVHPDTDQSVADRLGMPENTVRPRRVELLADGLVRAAMRSNGESIRQPTRSGRFAQVWEATPAARR